MMSLKEIIGIAVFAIEIIVIVNVLYLFIFSIAGLFNKSSIGNHSSFKYNNILVLFPAYKSDKIILDAVSRFSRQFYPSNSFSLYVIADSLSQETIKQLKSKGANIVEVFVGHNRNKAMSINAAISVIEKEYDYCLVVDADNVVEDDFLLSLNDYVNNGGVDVAQTRQVVGNSRCCIKMMKAFNMSLNNHIFNKGQTLLKFSATLVGSGMIFRYPLFKEIMDDINIFSNFEKELELALMERNIKIHYAENITIVDTKTDPFKDGLNGKIHFSLLKMRCFITDLFRTIKYILKGNFDFANKLFQYFLFSRVFTIILAVVSFFVIYTYFPYLLNSISIAMVMLVIALYIPVRKNFFSRETLNTSLVFLNALASLVISAFSSNKTINTMYNKKSV